jgi:hypothetical protein
MLMKQMYFVGLVLLLTSMLPFFKPFHEPVKFLYVYFSSL